MLVAGEGDGGQDAIRAERALQSGRVAQLADGDVDVAVGLLRSFIFGRSRDPSTGACAEAYVDRILELGGTDVEIGTSKTSKDGRADYLLVYDAGPRRYGAVAYVSAKNAGLALRLTRDDVADVADRVKFRDVQPRNGYQVNCPVTTLDAIDLAVQLTERALAKVRRPANTGPSATPARPSS